MNKITKPFDEEHDVVVVGAGIGGLSCGALLAKKGRGVKVFEQHFHPGGYCTSFSRKGFTFNSCVLWVAGCGPEGDMTRILSELGLRDRIEFRKMEPYCRIVLPGESFILPGSFDEWESMLVKRFPNEEEGIVKFVNTVKTIIEDMKKLPSRSPLILKYQDKPIKEMMDEYLTDPHLKLINAGMYFLGIPFSRISALSWCAGLKPRVDDTYWTVGGVQVLADLFASGLKEFGGSLELNTGVRKILIEDGKAIGVETTDGRKIKAGVVVSNAPVIETFGGLVSQKERDTAAPDLISKLRGMEINTSSMLTYLGVDLDIESLGINTIGTQVHETDDLDKGGEAAIQGNLADAPFMFAIPTLIDPSLAPAKKHTIWILVYAPYYLPGSDWNKKEKARLTDIMIRKADRVIPGLSKHIIVQDSATPRTLERYTLNTEGATSGWAVTLKNLFSKPEPKTPIENLYLTGQWTSHGSSVRGVAVSGNKVAKMIMGEQ